MGSTSAQVKRQVWSAITDAMLDAFPFDEESTTVMDYACGLGASPEACRIRPVKITTSRCIVPTPSTVL